MVTQVKLGCHYTCPCISSEANQAKWAGYIVDTEQNGEEWNNNKPKEKSIDLVHHFITH